MLRESIFSASVRSLCKACAAVIGICLGITLLIIGIGLFSESDMLPEKSEVKIAEDAMGRRALLPDSAPGVLRIDIHGVIGELNLTEQKVKNILLDSREDLLKKDRIKAVLLHISTPGGTVDDADGIYRALLEYKKSYKVPIYAFVDGLCASGGMYIAAASDRIYATSPSVIGSIGVITGPAFNLYDAMEKLGISSLTITAGKDKDMLNPFRPWKEGEDASLRAIINALYARFVTVVTTGRPNLSKDKLIEDYGAHVYVAAQAQEYGYIDVADSSYSEALTDLVKAASIKESEKYQVFRLSPPKDLLSEAFLSASPLITGKITHTLHGLEVSERLKGKFLYLYQPQK